MNPLVSIVIATRNRSSELKRALRSCMAQEYEPVEILVYDDASSDRTADMVKSEFPDVRLILSEKRVGLIVLRNMGFRDAQGEYVFSLDDDAYFADAGTVAETVKDFGRGKNIAAVAIPFVERLGADSGAGKAAAEGLRAGEQLCSYRGCAHAVIRRVVLEAGGYRDFLVHQGEERDLCIRLLAAGHEIVYGSAPWIVHDFSPARTPMRMRYYGIRNTLLFDLLNVPFPYVWERILKDSFALCFYMRRNILIRVVMLMMGLVGSIFYLPRRHPVSRKTWEIYRQRPGHAPLFAEKSLPPAIS